MAEDSDVTARSTAASPAAAGKSRDEIIEECARILDGIDAPWALGAAYSIRSLKGQPAAAVERPSSREDVNPIPTEVAELVERLTTRAAEGRKHGWEISERVTPPEMERIASILTRLSGALEAAQKALEPFAERVDQIERINSEIGLDDDTMATAPINHFRLARKVHQMLKGE